MLGSWGGLGKCRIPQVAFFIPRVASTCGCLSRLPWMSSKSVYIPQRLWRGEAWAWSLRKSWARYTKNGEEASTFLNKVILSIMLSPLCCSFKKVFFKKQPSWFSNDIFPGFLMCIYFWQSDTATCKRRYSNPPASITLLLICQQNPDCQQ